MSVRLRELMSSTEFKASALTVSLYAIVPALRYFGLPGRVHPIYCFQMPAWATSTLLIENAFEKIAYKSGAKGNVNRLFAGAATVACLSFSFSPLGMITVGSMGSFEGDMLSTAFSVGFLLWMRNIFSEKDKPVLLASSPK